MKFCFSTLFVSDLEKSLDFYMNVLELEIVRRFKTPDGGEIVFLGDENFQIELIHREGNSDIEVGKDISWAFSVDSAERTLEDFKARGLNVISEIIQPNPTTKFFYLKDPDGMKIQIIEQ